MKLDNQKRLAAQVLKCSKKRIKFDTESLGDIKEAITKADIRRLIIGNIIWKENAVGVSRVRARKRIIQRRKGKQKGEGSRKGSRNARLSFKEEWINKVRAQRELLRSLLDRKAINRQLFRELYLKSKGGFFRSRRHIKLYLEERARK
ncbi:MAG TPA: 50S ribosomal protein L19e [Candidatus Nanoarchaeia archaeon]|nr:50S ribosomal protein L19e [Candidatus Nanoarchaeia archaeon]